MNGFDHETLLVWRGRRSGTELVIAVHSTVLGPALGGCRIWRYRSLDAAIDDALRLSEAMTLKAAAAGLPLGGGKAVIYVPDDADVPVGKPRQALLDDFAEALNSLDGAYITAEDVGTTSADMARLGERSEHVVGQPGERGGSGDPGGFTAAGVEAAMRACCREVFGSRSLTGRTVAIIGVGHVGGALARRLAAEGAQLMLADIDLGKRALAAELDASWADPPQALRAAVDVLAPCALGGVIGAEEVAELRCRVICGGANNQLSDEAVADALAARRILYAPDFIVNAAGLINVSLELTRYDRAEAMRRAVGIEAVLGRILDHATGTRQTPLAAATELARRRLEAAAQHEAPADRHAARGLPRLRRREAAGSAASRSRLG